MQGLRENLAWTAELIGRKPGLANGGVEVRLARRVDHKAFGVDGIVAAGSWRGRLDAGSWRGFAARAKIRSRAGVSKAL